MSLTYPESLDEINSPFLKIVCYAWTTRGKRSQKVQSNKTVIETVFLPVSRNGLSETISNNWDVTEGLNNSSVGEFAKSAIGRKIQDAVPGLAKFTSFQTGQLLNDYSALTFSGNNFREFTLTYNMIPDSEGEAFTIREILNTFKVNSLPLYQGFKVLYPRFWRIELFIPNGESPIKFNDCVLIDVTSEYFQNDQHTVYRDGDVNTDLTLTFREITRLGRDNII